MNESWLSRHRGLVVFIIILLTFFAFKFGYVDKEDVRILVKGAAELTKEFTEYVKSLFH